MTVSGQKIVKASAGTQEPLFGVVRPAPDDGIERGATVSTCERYRYTLWQWWDHDEQALLFVMLNPSIADAKRDDPTIRKCRGFAERGGFGGIRVVNLYAWRATKPTDLKGVDPRDVVGEHGGILNRNDSAIIAASGDAGRIVVAWGADPGPIPLRRARVMDLLPRDRQIHALALTKDGSPRHPLYVPYAAEPVVYREARR